MTEEKNEITVQPVDKKKELPSFFSSLERATKLWWKHLKKIVLIYLEGLKLALIPLLILLSIIVLDFNLFSERFSLAWLDLVLFVASFLLTFYFFSRAEIAIFLFIKNGFKGEAKTLFKKTRPLFWPYFWLGLLTFILIFLWSLLLIIPGLIFSAYYVLAVYAFFSEGKKGWSAISRSKFLVNGYFWPIFGRFLFFFILAYLFGSIIDIPQSVLTEDSVMFKTWDLIEQVIITLVIPIFIIFFYDVYDFLAKSKK
ncbi:MAG: hypothetical protein PWQ35_112 [Patescibacteria group bacterium]|nr:hypothetical protein [Patescibacteria group bacterium]